MRVILCQRPFVPKILDGSKIHTIRGKARCKPGDVLSLRYWKDKPYRSKQVEFLRTTCKSVCAVELYGSEIWINGYLVRDEDLDVIAVHDGFADWPEMRLWFTNNHGLPWSGAIIEWEEVRKAG